MSHRSHLSHKLRDNVKSRGRSGVQALGEVGMTLATFHNVARRLSEEDPRIKLALQTAHNKQIELLVAMGIPI
jgi:hypothetical protein